MKRRLFCRLAILFFAAGFALTVTNKAESFRAREYLVSIATLGDLVLVGKLLAAEGKQDVQSGIVHTDVTVEVVQVIRNIMEQEVEVGSTINFRPLGGQIGNHRLLIVDEAKFDKEEIGKMLILSLKRPSPRMTANTRKGFDTVFDVFGGEYGKYTITTKNGVPMVNAFWLERRDEDIGLPLDLVLELMDMAVKVVSENPVLNPKTPAEVVEEVKMKYRRLIRLEESIRKLATDDLPEEVIIAISRAESARVKQELEL